MNRGREMRCSSSARAHILVMTQSKPTLSSRMSNCSRASAKRSTSTTCSSVPLPALGSGYFADARARTHIHTHTHTYTDIQTQTHTTCVSSFHAQMPVELKCLPSGSLAVSPPPPLARSRSVTIAIPGSVSEKKVEIALASIDLGRCFMIMLAARSTHTNFQEQQKSKNHTTDYRTAIAQHQIRTQEA